MSILAFLFFSLSGHADVPPISASVPVSAYQLPGSLGCPDLVRSYLSSSEYNGDEANDKIASACVNVDLKCVREVGESLSSGERAEAAKFLPLVKACKGAGKGDCYHDVLERTPSFDRATAAQAQQLIKKCE